MKLEVNINAVALKEFKKIISTTVERTITDVLKKEKLVTDNNNSDDDMLTRNEVMDMLKISHATLYRYQKEEILPCYRIGRRVFFKKKDIISNPNLEWVYLDPKGWD